MSKLILSIFIVSILSGCATARVGMTMTEFKDSCWNAAWEDATEVRLDASRSIVVCPITNGFKSPQYQLFEEGVPAGLKITYQASTEESASQALY